MGGPGLFQMSYICPERHCYIWLELFKYLGSMVLRVDLGDDVGDDAVLIDDVGLAEGSHADLAVVLLLAPGLIGLQDDSLRV